MTQEKEVTRSAADRKVATIVGKIVWWNMLQIRQRLIDEYWWNQLRLRDQASGVKRQTLRSMTVKQRAQFIHDVTPLVHDELGPLSFQPEEGDPLPPSKQTKEQFAKDTGIDDGRFDEIHARHQIPNVEELVAIARIGDVDITYLFIPPMDMLETDRTLILEPVNGKKEEVYSHRWVLWVRGLMQLPGQNMKKYLIETNAPSLKRSALSGNSTRTYKEIEMEINRRTKSSVSAIEAVKDEMTEINKVLNLDISTINPFMPGKEAKGYDPKRGMKLTSSANLLFGHLKKILSMALNSSSDRQRLKDRFDKALVGIHRALNQIIRGLKLTN